MTCCSVFFSFPLPLHTMCVVQRHHKQRRGSNAQMWKQDGPTLPSTLQPSSTLHWVLQGAYDSGSRPTWTTLSWLVTVVLCCVRNSQRGWDPCTSPNVTNSLSLLLRLRGGKPPTRSLWHLPWTQPRAGHRVTLRVCSPTRTWLRPDVGAAPCSAQARPMTCCQRAMLKAFARCPSLGTQSVSNVGS